MLIISDLGGGIETLRHYRVLFLLIICAVCGACSKPKPADGAPSPVEVKSSLFYDRDSVMYYAERAYELDDPKGCFVVGACYFLRRQGDLPDYITTVKTQKEAQEMLLISAGQDYKPAKDAIHCLRESNQWVDFYKQK